MPFIVENLSLNTHTHVYMKKHSARTRDARRREMLMQTGLKCSQMHISFHPLRVHRHFLLSVAKGLIWCNERKVIFLLWNYSSAL